MNCGVSLRRNSTVSRTRCAGALSCWKTNTSPAMLQIAVAASAAATCLVILPVDFCSRLNEDEVGTAEFGCCKSACIEYQSKLRKRLVATWAEFQQSVVERNFTFSQMKKFCISQDSVVAFFRCGG